MGKHISVEDIERYPDLTSCFCDRNNQRQREEYRRFLYRAVKTQLTQRQRQVVLMHFFQGMSLRAIADELRVHPSSVTRVMRRAMQRLGDLAYLYFEIR